jgi:succinate dehydrogenase/fumarate reductase flavoprotein subunit
LIVAGAGLAGLCAAVRLRELGHVPTVLEKGDRPGGSMLLSSGVAWRYRTLEDFRRACPGGDEALQRQIVDRLDDGLAWLEAAGAPVLAKETANPRTVGWRFDTRGLTRALAEKADVQLSRALTSDDGTALQQPVLLATGGFPHRLAELFRLPLRANPWSEGDGLDFARARGAATTAGMDEFYGRAMPAPPARWGEAEYVEFAQVYGRAAEVVDENNEPIAVDPDDWSENGLVQEIARRGGRAWFLVPPDALDHPTPYGTVAEAIERVRLAGGTVEERGSSLAVHVVSAVTHTIGGIAIDERARVLDTHGEPIGGLCAAGVDAGGIATGGYASGLAAALVFGLIAAEELAS